MSTLYTIQPIRSADALSLRLVRLPILVLNVHTLCNCRCLMCDIWKRKDGRALTLADLTVHGDSVLRLGVRQVVLTGGEPLLNRELLQIAHFCKDLGARVTLLTSGLLLGAKAAAIADCMDEIIVSVDGPAAIHDHIRQVPNGFRKIRSAVEAVRRYRQDISISCRTTVQKANHAHLCQTVGAAKSIGLNSTSFLAADISSSAFNRTPPWDHARQNMVALTADEVDRLDQEMERLIRMYAYDIDYGFILVNPAKLRRISTRFRAHLEGTPRAPLCNAPWKSAIIEVNGDVRPCFFHAPVASIASQPLLDALNSRQAVAFREGLDIATNPICQRCVSSLNYLD